MITGGVPHYGWMVYGWFIMENPMKDIKINDLSHY
jgi:hypothetical protein